MVILGAILVLVIGFLLTNRRYRWFYIIFKTYKRDIRALRGFLSLNIQTWVFQKNDLTIPKIFTNIASQNPTKAAFYFVDEDATWTFKDVEDFSNRIANYFKSEGYKKDDCIALLFANKPEYVAIWLGLSKIGITTALINTNLVSDPLAHSVKIANAKAIIHSSNFESIVDEIATAIEPINRYQFRGKFTNYKIAKNLAAPIELSAQSDTSPRDEIKSGKFSDKLLFVYTSGTTGLPKAAVITHMRFSLIAIGANCMAGLNQNDTIYNPLPLYHTSGGILGAGQCLIKGIPVVIRSKFSASNFWSDCIKHNCTAAQYIGETCRYILAAHHNDSTEIKHSVKKMIGNGLRPQIWKEFVTKFGLKEIYEIYGSTEGNANIVNIDNTIGSVGFIPRYAQSLYPLSLIKCDEAGEPIRAKNNFCIQCKPEEPGILIGFVDQKKVINDFRGYVDAKATKKKLLRDVFKKGDLYFNTGDILVQDELGYMFFKDRTGDTFRWKGENVATSEIEAVISNTINLTDAIVYGVEIPGNEGRAGMVAIVDTDNTLNLGDFAKGLKKSLPSYAIPIFLRVMDALPMTGTFKLKKNDLQKDGYDIGKIGDAIYYYDAKNVTYLRLTEEAFNNISTGKIRV